MFFFCLRTNQNWKLLHRLKLLFSVPSTSSNLPCHSHWSLCTSFPLIVVLQYNIVSRKFLWTFVGRHKRKIVWSSSSILWFTPCKYNIMIFSLSKYIWSSSSILTFTTYKSNIFRFLSVLDVVDELKDLTNIRIAIYKQRVAKLNNNNISIRRFQVWDLVFRNVFQNTAELNLWILALKWEILSL